MSDEDRRKALRQETVDGLRKARDEARMTSEGQPPLSAHPVEPPTPKPLAPIEAGDPESAPSSPAREELNVLWNISELAPDRPEGTLARWFSPLKAPLRRMVRFAMGPFVERQVRMNSAQVRFDNDLVRYVDERFDRMSRHYDRVLGLHGRRMEEIDERHLILQQELVRHVHDLVARIELVFESAEQNHLYLEGMLRETREDLMKLSERLASLARGKP
ncbi:MAG: hypothetical protein ACRD3V_29710 [Vicinamibacteria bacterium]